ncbi:MAG: DinB family protein [Roseococcus sp.]
MITPAYCRAMAAYNSEMNRRLYGSAARLEEAARRLDLGAFFASLHGTLCHILWADRVWMHRLAGWERPAQGIPDSPGMIGDWEALRAARAEDDARIEAWAEALSPDALAGELTWFSGAARREMTKPRWLCVAHMFNHQTHHRGQAHALLTRLGAAPGDTDLPWVIPDRAW